MSDPVAIVGASVRAAAASAVRAGFEPVAADRFADDDLVRIAPTTRVANYPHEFLEWLAHLAPTPRAWMYTGALENHPELVAAMADRCPLWGNGGTLLREVRSPWRLAEALGKAGLRFPETRATPAGLPRDGSWLVKTGRGAGGSGVRALVDAGGWGRATDGEPPDSTNRWGLTDVRHQSLGHMDVVFQRRVAGDSVSAVFVAAGGSAVLLGVVNQLVGKEWLRAGEFQYCGAIGPFSCGESTFAEIERIGGVLAGRFGLAGLFGVDLAIDGHQVWTIEVNPRYTASVEVVERVTGVRAIAAHADACVRRVLPPCPIPRVGDTCGKAILFAKRNVRVSEDFAEWANRESRAAVWPSVADLSPAGTTIDAGQPIMSLFASGTTADDVENRLRYRVAEIKQSLYGKKPVRE